MYSKLKLEVDITSLLQLWQSVYFAHVIQLQIQN